MFSDCLQENRDLAKIYSVTCGNNCFDFFPCTQNLIITLIETALQAMEPPPKVIELQQHFKLSNDTSSRIAALQVE